MSKNRMVNTQFWSDSFIDQCPATAKLLYIYLLTNDRTNIAGVYEITVRKIAFEIDTSEDIVVALLKSFETAGKIKYADGWIAIKKFTLHQALTPKTRQGILNELAKAPEWVLDWTILPSEILDDLENSLFLEKNKNNSLSNLIKLNSIKSNSNSIQEKKDSFSEDTKKVYEHYIEKFQANPNQFKLTDSRKVKIKQRLKDAGYEMIIKAIDNTSESNFHRGENERGWKADLDFIIRKYEQVERLSNLDKQNNTTEFSIYDENPGSERTRK